MRKLFIVTTLLGAGYLSDACAASLQSEKTMAPVIAALEKYGQKQCSADKNDCIYIGPLVAGRATFKLADGTLLVKPATYLIQLQVTGSVLELRANVRTVSPARPSAPIPDLYLMVDRGADGAVDAIIAIPFAEAIDTSGEVGVGTPLQGCWDREGKPFCAKTFAPGDLDGLQRMYTEAVRVTMETYTRLLLSLQANSL